MNILLINHYAGSYKIGMEYRPFYIAREWIKLGYKVTIVAASYSHLRTQNPHITSNLTEETISGIQYIWLKTPSYKGNGIRRVLNILIFVIQLFRYSNQLINHVKPDIVINSSTYPLDTYPAQFIARKSKAKLVFEVHDLWPLSPIELGGMSPKHPFIRLMQQAENSAYHQSDLVVSLLPKADTHMQRHGMASHKFVYVPNGIDVNEWAENSIEPPQQHREILAQIRRSGSFIVGYTGGHSISNALSFLIDAATLLKNHPSLSFVLVGKGSEKEALQQQVKYIGLKNVIFLPPIPKNAIPSLLSSMDALFIGWQKLSIYQFGISPNKLMDYMMAARPIIHSISDGNDLVAESGCGISVPAEDSQAIAQGILQLMNQTVVTRKDMGIRGRNYIIAHYNYSILSRRFLDAMGNINSQGSS